MIAVFSILLEALRACWRSYRVEVGRDLFGDWLVEVTFGRIGTDGRTVGFVADIRRMPAGAALPHRRASAPPPYGRPCRELERFDPNGWI